MSTTTQYKRLDARQERTRDGLWAARVLCLGAMITALAAGTLIGFMLISAPVVTSIRIVTLIGAGGFGWCSISFLCGAAIATTSATSPSA